MSRSRALVIVIAALVASALPSAAQAPAASPAPAAPAPAAVTPAVPMPKGGKAFCLKCHADYDAKLEGKSVHGPVAEDRCVACHNPHTSSHGKLLEGSTTGLCYECHDDVRKDADQPIRHMALRDAKSCLACHSPHASEHGKLLTDEQAALCVTCHEGVGASMKLAREHAPVAGGDCSTCHQPHGGPEAALLNKKAGPLCKSCHATTPALVAKHKGFAIADADCLSCHNPHGAAAAGLLRETVHPAFQSGCDTCHAAPAKPNQLNAAQPDLCLACHPNRDPKADEAHNHPIGSKASCTGCHSPHAGEGKGMIRGAERRVCLDCHTAIRQAVETSKSFHPLKVGGGKCSTCHEPHGAKDVKLLREPETQLCVGCHEDHSKFAHPMGPNVPDPRRKGKAVTCLSCHDAHASDQKAMLLGSPERELCIGCHGEFTR